MINFLSIGRCDSPVVEVSKRNLAGPKRHIYRICQHANIPLPVYSDPAAGGYAMKYILRSKKECEELVSIILDSAKALGVKVFRYSVKPCPRYIRLHVARVVVEGNNIELK